jgi:hypothetical protein
MTKHTVRTSLLLAALTLTAGAACKKKEEGGASSSGGTAAKTADKPPAAPVALTWKKIASMGIEVEVAADADVQDNTASSGFPSSTIYSTDGTPTTFIFGAKGDLAESMALSKDFDATKARVQKEMNGFKSFTKEDKAGEGFELLYTGASMMDPAKSLYGVTIRSSAAGLTLDCSTNAESEAEREKTIRLCKSIRAAK